MRVFISYAHEDMKKVQRYVTRLKNEKGFDVFWDKDLSPSESIFDALAKEASSAPALIVFLSKAARESEYVQREVLMAASKKAQVIPVLLQPLESGPGNSGLDMLLNNILAIKAYDMTVEDTCQAVFNALRKAARKDSGIVVTVMGLKGGVGKSTIITAMAELIASTGNSVVIIDADVESAGITKYLGPRARRHPHVWTVKDAAYARSERTAGSRDMGFWDVTPPYLMDGRFGRIYLIPGSLPGDMRSGFEAMADIPPDEREAAALDILKEMSDRATQLPSKVSCFLIDSGAENNPLVSAGFVRATYGYLISGPNPEFASDIPRLERMHRDRYPEHEICSMNLIVNQSRATTPALWLPGVSFLPEDESVREHGAKGTFDFEVVGLNEFFLCLLNIIAGHFSSEHQDLLPDEADVWVRPWIKQIVDRKLPRRVMTSAWFRAARITSALLPVIGLLLASYFGYRNYEYMHRPRLVTATKLAMIELASNDEAVSVRDSINSGADFSEIARTRSLDAQTARSGGIVDTLLMPDGSVPGLVDLPGMHEKLDRTPAGTLCQEVFSYNGKGYVFKVVERPTVPAKATIADQARQFLSAIGMLAGVVCLVLGPWQFVKWRRRKRLLVEVEKRGADGEYMVKLLRDSPERGALKWLKDLLKEAIALER